MFVPGAALPCEKLQFLAHADAQRCLLFLGIVQHLAREKPWGKSLLGRVLGSGSAPRLAGWDDARLRVAVVKLQDGGLLPSPDAQVAVRISATLGAQCTERPPSPGFITLSPRTGPRQNTLLTPRSALSLLQALKCRWAAAVARRRMPCGLACSPRTFPEERLLHLRHVDATGRLWLSEGGALAAWHLPSGQPCIAWGQ